MCELLSQYKCPVHVKYVQDAKLIYKKSLVSYFIASCDSLHIYNISENMLELARKLSNGCITTFFHLTWSILNASVTHVRAAAMSVASTSQKRRSISAHHPKSFKRVSENTTEHVQSEWNHCSLYLIGGIQSHATVLCSVSEKDSVCPNMIYVW